MTHESDAATTERRPTRSPHDKAQSFVRQVQILGSRNSGSWRAGRCRSRSPKFCPPVISTAHTVAVHRLDSITPSRDRCHRTSSKRISSAHPHSSQSPVPTKKVVLIESVEFVTPRPVGWPSYVHPTGRNSTKRLSGWAFAKSSQLRSHAGRMPTLSD